MQREGTLSMSFEQWHSNVLRADFQSKQPRCTLEVLAALLLMVVALPIIPPWTHAAVSQASGEMAELLVLGLLPVVCPRTILGSSINFFLFASQLMVFTGRCFLFFGICELDMIG